jgi:hypothetical protein
VVLPGDIGEPEAWIDAIARLRALAAASGRIPAFSGVAGCRKIRHLAGKPRRESLDAQPEISADVAFFPLWGRSRRNAPILDT